MENKKFVGGYGIANSQGQREHCPGVVVPEKQYVDPKFKAVSSYEILKKIKENTRLHKEKMEGQKINLVSA